MESVSHANLKRAALEFLMLHGCAAAAIEVACPISRWRIDAAGYLDKLPERRRREPQAGPFPRGDAATSVFIECKASRSDFLRDQRHLPALLQRREHLQRALDRLRNELVKPMEPHLRRSDGFLFPEMESWDFCFSRLHSHRAIVRALRQLDRKLYDETKFFMIAQYRLATRLFILAPRGMIHPREVPTGWGLLEMDGSGAIGVRHDGAALAPPEHRLLRVLRNIAVAASRDHRNAVIRRAITPGAASVPGRAAVPAPPTPEDSRTIAPTS